MFVMIIKDIVQCMYILILDNVNNILTFFNDLYAIQYYTI